MNSLSELNGFGATSLTVTDERPSKVIFDRQPPLIPIDQVYNITSTTVSVTPGINILEVINYSTANVRYRVTINTGGSPLLTGSTVSWASLPGTVTYTVVGSTYTLGGIDSKAIWDQIKNFTWNLPANYATRPNWFLQVSIIYYDSALGRDVTTSWLVYDEDFYYVAEFSSSFTISCVAQDVKLASASLFCSTAIALDPKLLEGIINTVNVSATVSCEARLKPKDAELDVITNLELKKFTAILGNLRATLPTVTSSLNVVPSVIFNLIGRNYIANDENNLFATNTPFIDDNASGTFEISLTSPIGMFSLGPFGTPYSTLTLSGTAAQVNNYFTQINFYPNKNITSNSTLTYLIKRNTVTIENITANLTYSSTAGPVPSQYYVFTRIPSWSIRSASQYTSYSNFIFVTGTSGYTWNPPNRQRIYATTKIFVIGAGGNGGNVVGSVAGGGGGGGSVLRLTNYPLPIGGITINPGNKEISGDAYSNSSITLPDGSKINVPNGGDAGDYSGGGASDDGGGSGQTRENIINSHNANSFSGGRGFGNGGGGAGRGPGEDAFETRHGRGGGGYDVNNFSLLFPNSTIIPNLFGNLLETSSVDPFRDQIVYRYDQSRLGHGGNGGAMGAFSNDYFFPNDKNARGGPWGLNFPPAQTYNGENARGYGQGGGGGGSGGDLPGIGGKGGPGLIIVYFGDS